MSSGVVRRRTRARAIAGVSALACCLLMLVAGTALTDTPPTLSVALNKLPANAGYTVTATLSAASTYDCTMGTNDPTQAVYPDLSGSQDPSVDTSGADSFTGALLNPVNDQLAGSCDATSWTTAADQPFGVPGSSNPPGLWYFQVATYCPLYDATDPTTDSDCLNPLGYHYTNVASVTVPTVNASSTGTGGSASGSGGSGSGSGGSGSGSGSGGSGSGSSSACHGLKGAAASQCNIGQSYSKALAACAKKTGKLKTSCRKSATVTDHRQLALLKCQAKKGKLKATCVKKADAIKS